MTNTKRWVDAAVCLMRHHAIESVPRFRRTGKLLTLPGRAPSHPWPRQRRGRQFDPVRQHHPLTVVTASPRKAFAPKILNSCGEGKLRLVTELRARTGKGELADSIVREVDAFVK